MCGFVPLGGGTRAEQGDDHRDDEKDEEELRDGDAAGDGDDRKQEYENPDQRVNLPVP